MYDRLLQNAMTDRLQFPTSRCETADSASPDVLNRKPTILEYPLLGVEIFDTRATASATPRQLDD